MVYRDAFEPLRHVVLEDSWVLSLSRDDQSLAFDLEVALSPDHQHYRPPAPGEQHCYLRAQLCIGGDMTCAMSDAPPATDARGSKDHGHIDVWTVDEDGVSRLEGDWGTVEVRSTAVTLSFT